MELKKITKNDLTLWQEFRTALYGSLRDKYHQIEMKQILESDIWWCYFVVNESGSVLGLVELSARNIVDGCLSSPVAYLEGLYLKPRFQNKGIGKEIIKLVLNWCKKHGFSELATDTELANTGAQKFYKTVGFEEVDRVVSFRMGVDKL